MKISNELKRKCFEVLYGGIANPLPTVLKKRNMRQFFILVVTFLFAQTNCAQKITFFIIGDNVNVRSDTTFTSNNIYQVNWGTKYQGIKVSNKWYSFIADFHLETKYISSEYVADKKLFYDLAERKMEKNGNTKYELLLHYKIDGQVDKAESLLFDIINENSRELIGFGFEDCELLGPYAYVTMLVNQDGYLDYNNKSALDIIEKVIDKSQDSIITALALLDKAKFCLRKGKLIETKETLFFLLENYSDNLVIPIPCDYDLDSKIYPRTKFKNLFLAMAYLMDKPEQQNTFEKIEQIKEMSNNIKTKEIAKDIYFKLIGNLWVPY